MYTHAYDVHRTSARTHKHTTQLARQQQKCSTHHFVLLHGANNGHGLAAFEQAVFTSVKEEDGEKWTMLRQQPRGCASCKDNEHGETLREQCQKQ